MDIRDRVARLQAELPAEPQYPTQGATVFVDLERRETSRGYTPLRVVRAFLAGRGANMFYLLPAARRAARAAASARAADLRIRRPHRDRAERRARQCHVLVARVGRADGLQRGRLLPVVPEDERHRSSGPVRTGSPSGLCCGSGKACSSSSTRGRTSGSTTSISAIASRRISAGRGRAIWPWPSITRAGENLVLTSAIMAGPKACYARGGPGAKMGSLRLKAVVTQGQTHDFETAQPYKGYNRHIAQQLLDTSVVKHALKARGTPFLYKPSRLLGAMGTKNHQETTWTDRLDAEHIDPYRPGMAGCFRCPVNCRPLNDLHRPAGDRYDAGDGPEYVTLGKFGPNVGIDRVESVIRLNNICNDLGLDTASAGSAIAWAMELFQRGIITTRETGGLDLTWGRADVVEQLLFMMSRREGFGNVLADSTRAVERGHYPAEALRYRMAVKGLMQSDPHDARILKAFALGLAVATRGMDHLRNRVTLEINARINDDPAFKERLYGGPVSAQPNAYEGKEIAVRVCENTFAVGDAVGMCRFTTKLFNSPSLPGFEQFATQIGNVTGFELAQDDLSQVGLNIMGLERLINQRLGVTRRDDTLPERWFEEPITVGAYAGERIDRQEFDELLTRFYRVSNLTDDGLPVADWRRELEAAVGAS